MELTREQEQLLESVIENVHQEVPTNPSIGVDAETLRFSGASWFEKIKTTTVLLAGCGGIGSYVAFFLARVQPFKIIIFDPDYMEEVNMAGQLFSNQDIGVPKVVSTSKRLKEYSNYFNTDVFICEYTESSPAQDIMICGFDNMLARKIFFYNWKARVFKKMAEGEDTSEMLFIDGRIKCLITSLYK